MRADVFVPIRFHEYKCARARTEEHTEPCCGETHPSALPHLENPKTKLKSLFFNYLSSQHRHHHHIHLNSPTVSLPPSPLPPAFSLLSNASMCYHHKHASRSQVTHRNLVVIISTSKRWGEVTHDLFNSLQLIANKYSAASASQRSLSFGCGGGFNEDLRTLPWLLIQ